MQNQTTVSYVGVDISKGYLDFDLPAPFEHITNKPEDILKVFKQLPASAHLVCEATGGYQAALLGAAFEQAIPISLISPQRVRHFALGAGQQGKTDRLDAKVLSDYGRKHTPAPLRRPSDGLLRLRECLRAREQLIELQKLERNWVEHEHAQSLLQKQARKRRELIEKQLAEIQARITKIISQPEFCSRVERLREVSGVGPITASTLCAEMPELGSLESGQASALAGLAPYPRDSGKRQAKRYIRKGRPQVRRVLYMAALAAIRFNPILKEFYLRLKKNGKASKVALIAVARKLIELLNLILKNPNFCLSK